MACNRVQKKLAELEGLKKYHRALLHPIFCAHLKRRKRLLEENIYHLRVIAQDCNDWKDSDLEAITRGMEVSLLKYRLAKELGQEARKILNSMLSEVYPYLRDAHGLEQTVWEVFDNDDSFGAMDTERDEAKSKLYAAGFRLQKLSAKREIANEPELKDVTEKDICDVLLRETTLTDKDTEELLAVLEEKKQYLEKLRVLECSQTSDSY